jgi:folate-dependent phosphoribosylglycinamide formyltransferase PurN
MVALLEAARAPDFPAEIALVLSNKADAGGLALAAAAGYGRQWSRAAPSAGPGRA